MFLVKLKPLGTRKFHFGAYSLEEDDIIFHSDSLFSAICNNYVAEYGNEKIKEFIYNFPRITSLFYGYNYKGKDLFFVPKPLGKKLPKKMAEENRKMIKKVKFIEMSLLFQSLKDSEEELSFLKKGGFLSKEKLDANIYDEIIEEKIKINRKTGATEEGMLFYVSGVVLNEKSFFYFLIDIDELSEELRRSIELLEVFGIGGEITSGFGQCGVEIIKINKNEFIKNEGDKYTNLSLVIPKEEQKNDIEKWELIERKGYVYGTNNLKKSIFAIKEGAVFNKEMDGQIVEVGEQAYRYGKSFLVKFVE
jgi:CRISPR-associated protein Csm4